MRRHRRHPRRLCSRDTLTRLRLIMGMVDTLIFIGSGFVAMIAIAVFWRALREAPDEIRRLRRHIDRVEAVAQDEAARLEERVTVGTTAATTDRRDGGFDPARRSNAILHEIA